ncbi:MAG: molybdopterin-dependent oxidoreductase [Coriobacteriia bacterium]
MSREKIIADLQKRHDGVTYTYTTCVNNGCWDASCVLRCAVKDGKVVSIEPDDSINKGDAREDVGEQALKEGMVQLRPCPMGHAWRQELYAPTRLLYPMKRVGERGPGKGHFERITWEEALDTIAGKMAYVRDNFGQASIMHCQYGAFERSDFPLAPWFDAGFACWGDHSTSGHAPGEKFHLGVDLVDIMFKGTSVSFPGSEAPDILNSKLIVLWGLDALVGWYGTLSYYMKLAQERGAKVIVIEPRYTVSAEVLADQWIPIRPGTDTAMMLAIAYVLFKDDIYDHEYVDRYVEPVGFEHFRQYVMGEEDGEAKTPEWAESICAVPAETIYGFAHLYAASQPVHLQAHYSIAKRNLGEYAGSCSMLLQAMTGNLSIPGGCESGCCLVCPPHLTTPILDWGRAPADCATPVVCNNNKLTEAMYCRKLYDQGHIDEQEFRDRIGSPPGAPLPNIQMAIMDNNYVNNQHHVNKRMQGFDSLHFNWGWQWHEGQPSGEFLDIVLPAPIHQFETMDTYFFGQERFFLGPSGMRNYFVYCDKAVNAPGEIRPKEWVYTELAKRLGIAEKYNPKLLDVSWEDWDDAVRSRIYRPAYEAWAADEDGFLASIGIYPKPWDEFLEMPVVRVPIDEPFYPFKNVVEAGESPFLTPSGKVEFESSFLKSVDLSATRWRGHMDAMPRWKPSYTTEPANDGYYHPKTAEYPLSLVTPVTIYRQHSSNDRNPWLRDCYRHGVWINPADAVGRGVADGDTVRVFNEYGEVLVPAYVTAKTIPGTVAIHHGTWYRPNTDAVDKTMRYGIDTNGNCNLLIGDTHLPHAIGALLTASLVEVEKYGGEE